MQMKYPQQWSEDDGNTIIIFYGLCKEVQHESVSQCVDIVHSGLGLMY